MKLLVKKMKFLRVDIVQTQDGLAKWSQVDFGISRTDGLVSLEDDGLPEND